MFTRENNNITRPNGKLGRELLAADRICGTRQKILLRFSNKRFRVSKADADRILFSGDHEDIIRSFRKSAGAAQWILDRRRLCMLVLGAFGTNRVFGHQTSCRKDRIPEVKEAFERSAGL